MPDPNPDSDQADQGTHPHDDTGADGPVTRTLLTDAAGRPYVPIADSTAPYYDPDWLRNEYWEKGQTIADLAEKANITDMTICNWMDRHDIPRRNPGETPPGDTEHSEGDADE